MIMTIESTDEISHIDGVPCRTWVGKTEGGTKVLAFIAVIAARYDEDCMELENDLAAIHPPAFAAVPVSLRED